MFDIWQYRYTQRRMGRKLPYKLQSGRPFTHFYSFFWLWSTGLYSCLTTWVTHFPKLSNPPNRSFLPIFSEHFPFHSEGFTSPSPPPFCVSLIKETHISVFYRLETEHEASLQKTKNSSHYFLLSEENFMFLTEAETWTNKFNRYFLDIYTF